MKFFLGFLFALFVVNMNPTTAAYMVMYLNSLHKVVEDKIIEDLQRIHTPKQPSKLESI